MRAEQQLRRADDHMFAGHNPYLVMLSVSVAILGGYTGFGLAARIRGTPGVNARLLLSGAAGILAVGIWTMHFIGILAAPIPANTVYLTLPTIVSFLICALVIGISMFFVSIGEPSHLRIVASALLMGIGIASMHYVGMTALVGPFHMVHDPAIVALAVIIAIGSAYGGLRIFLARQGGLRLALSAVAFGVAVSGMHYTAMYGMHFVPSPDRPPVAGLVASNQILALVVAVLTFLIAGAFLLSLVPDQRGRIAMATADGAAFMPDDRASPQDANIAARHSPAIGGRPTVAPLRGLGQPRSAPAQRLPVEGSEGTYFMEISEVRSIKADAHYTLVHDGQRERMCPWSISEAEAVLDPAVFLRVHRSHIVAIPHIALLRKEGDGAVVELDGAQPHLAPVSRPKVAELRARLGLAKRISPAADAP